MRDNEKSNGKKVMGSAHFLANLLLIFSGILFYLGLSHLNDLRSALSWVYQIIWPFVMAFVVAWLLNPIVGFFERRLFRRGRPGTRRGLSVLVAYVLVLLILGALLYVVLPQVYESLMILVTRVPDYLKNLKSAVDSLAQDFELVDEENADFLVESYAEILTRISEWVQGILPQIINVGFSLGSGIVNVLMAFIASIYILLSKERLLDTGRRLVYALLPSPQDEKLLGILHRSNQIFTGFIDGKLLDSLIIGVLCLVGTLLLRLPFAGLLSLIVGVTNIIPFFGPFIGAVPCVMILLIVDPWGALWFTLFIIALQQLDGNVIGPRILGDSTGVSALGVLVAISLGGSIGGVAGMLLGVPLYAISSLLLREWLDLRLLRKKNAAARAAEAANPAPVQAAEGEEPPAEQPETVSAAPAQKENES